MVGSEPSKYSSGLAVKSNVPNYAFAKKFSCLVAFATQAGASSKWALAATFAA